MQQPETTLIYWAPSRVRFNLTLILAAVVIVLGLLQAAGFDPLAIMEAWAGSTETVTLCGSFYPCGTWMANEEIGKSWYNVQDIERAKKMIQDTGYAGEEVIILDPSNNS